jgi:hypothetical protein
MMFLSLFQDKCRFVVSGKPKGGGKLMAAKKKAKKKATKKKATKKK